MQRRVPGTGSVQVRSFLDEDLAKRPLAAQSGESERAGAIGRRVIDIGASVQQEPADSSSPLSLQKAEP